VFRPQHIKPAAQEDVRSFGDPDESHRETGRSLNKTKNHGIPAMYLEHFGLKRQPFKITPDTSLFYKGNKRGAALEALKYAIITGEGIIKVVGEVGTGKTMLCRMLEIELPEYVDVVYIANPSLSPENILHVIAFELKLAITNQSSKLEVMQLLQNYLLEKHAHNRQVVVFVEEAQSMPLETLEEIRLLSNLETGDHKLLQMVLFGQPELDMKLRDPSIRQLKERITHSFYLDPFPRQDIYDYLNFRMRAVGYHGPDIFSERVASSIEKQSRGLTRRINILADKALLAAFSEGGHGISARHIKIAAKDSEFRLEKSKKLLTWLALAAALALAMWIGTLIPGVNSSTTIAPQKQDRPNQQAQVVPQPSTPKPVQAPTPDQSQSLLQQRLTATRSWISSAADDDFTIQLSLQNPWADKSTQNYLESLASQLEANKIYMYKAMIRGRPVYSVLYNDYENRAQAVEELTRLPESIRGDGAFLRTVKGIKSDIRKTEQQQAKE